MKQVNDLEETREEERIRFSREIEIIKEKEPDLLYLEIISDYCESHDIEVATIKDIMTPALASKLHRECADRNLLKEKTRSLV